MALEQIGQKLKAARESQGLTLAQIYERTKIPINHLQAIDSGVADDLPEVVYVAGFIKRYGDCVGLNGPSLSDEYRRSAEVNGNGNGNGNSRSMGAVRSAPVMVSPAYAHKVRTEERQPNLLKTVVFPAFWLIIFVGIIWVLFRYNQENSSNQTDANLNNLRESTSKFNSVQPAANPNTPVQSGPTSTSMPTPVATPAAPASNEAQISISASHHVWVEIKAISTGETLYSGNLEAGDQRDYKDPQGIRVHAGNGGSLTIVQDGKSQTLGPAGKIVEKVFVTKAAPGTATTATGVDASKTGVNGTAATTAVKPVVKKVVKKAASTDGAATPKRRYRSVDDMPSRGYIPGESVGGSRSIDVPYRYTEGGRDSE